MVRFHSVPVDGQQDRTTGERELDNRQPRTRTQQESRIANTRHRQNTVHKEGRRKEVEENKYKKWKIEIGDEDVTVRTEKGSNYKTND